MQQIWAAGALALGLCGIGPGAWAQDELRIIALGDLPYGSPDVVNPPYEALIDEINQEGADLVIHLGDTKGGGPCTDAHFTTHRDYMMRFEAPVLYTPGDNEWTDCHRSGDDPQDRLAVLRDIYFKDPNLSLGQREVELEHQGGKGFPENARLLWGQIGIMTAHVVGSNNGFEAREISNVQEYFTRTEAVTAWIEDGFAQFKAADIIVVALHADMFEFDFNMFGEERWLRHSGFGQIGETLKSQAHQFGKPVLLLFGDSHVYRVFQPFPKGAPNVTAVETFGHPDMHAVAVTLHPKNKPWLQVAPVWNPAPLE